MCRTAQIVLEFASMIASPAVGIDLRAAGRFDWGGCSMSGRSTRPSSDPNRPRSGTWRHVVVAVVLALVSVLGIGPAVAQPQPGADQAPPVINPQARAADLVQPAVVFVRVHFDAWVVTDLFGTYKVPLDYSCSGFVVNPDGYIVTAGHCVRKDMEGAQGDAVIEVVDQLVQEGRVSFFERDQLIDDVMVGNREWQVEGLLDGSKPDRKVSVIVGGGKVKFGKVNSNGTRPARVMEEPTEDHGDMALLRVSRKGLPSVLLTPENEIEVGEELLAIGYPAPDDPDESFGLTNRNGQVNSEITKGSSNQTYYETSTNGSEGMSGGPEINLRGEVVGLLSWKNEDANYIVPASVIREMLNRHNVRNELGQIDQLYRRGLENLYRGAYSDSIKDFDQVLALMPGHRLAQAKKTQAAERREKFGDPPPPVDPDKPGLSRIVPLAGAAAAVLVVLGATAALVLRRRKGGAHRRRRRAPAPAPYTGNAGWGSTPPPVAQAPDAAMAGYDQLDDPDLAPTGPAEPSPRDAYPAMAEALRDPAAADGSVRDGARAATSVSVWDPEEATGSQPAAEPARAVRNFCSSCGSRVRPDDLHCLGCGVRLD
jgi:serine protease Do